LASATESYAASALYTTLASLSGALWRIRRARYGDPSSLGVARYQSQAHKIGRLSVQTISAH
jgi:hypothetical protein